MRVYGTKIHDAATARERRKAGMPRHSVPCAYEVHNLHTDDFYWQAERDADVALEMAQTVGTGRYRVFEGSMEDWMDGKPWTIKTVAKIQ